MYKEFEYKEQGDGSDSWAVSEWEDNTKETLINKYMIYDFIVQNWKLKAELNRRGMLTSVETALDGLPEPTKTEAKLAWDYSPTINMSSSATKLIKSVLGLSSEDVLDVFDKADQIEI